MGSNYSFAQKSESGFLLLRQTHKIVDFMVKDRTAVTKFKPTMVPGSHPNEKEKKPPQFYNTCKVSRWLKSGIKMVEV